MSLRRCGPAAGQSATLLIGRAKAAGARGDIAHAGPLCYQSRRSVASRSAARQAGTGGGRSSTGVRAPLALDHCRAGTPPSVLRCDEAARDHRACTPAGRPRGLGALNNRRSSAPGCMCLGHEPTADCRTRSSTGSTASPTLCHCCTSSAVAPHTTAPRDYPFGGRITRA